eukprot:jgi/Mesen1/2438/ME000157S01575
MNSRTLWLAGLRGKPVQRERSDPSPIAPPTLVASAQQVSAARSCACNMLKEKRALQPLQPLLPFAPQPPPSFAPEEGLSAHYFQNLEDRQGARGLKAYAKHIRGSVAVLGSGGELPRFVYSEAAEEAAARAAPRHGGLGHAKAAGMSVAPSLDVNMFGVVERLRGARELVVLDSRSTATLGDVERHSQRVRQVAVRALKGDPALRERFPNVDFSNTEFVGLMVVKFFPKHLVLEAVRRGLVAAAYNGKSFQCYM